MTEVNTHNSNKSEVIVTSFLNDVLKQIMALLDAECGSLFLFDSNSKELILDSFYNSVNLNLGRLRQRVGEGVSGKVADIKKPILVKDIDSDSRFNRNGYNHYHTKSFISMPLFGAQGLLGIMNIADKKTGEPFSEKDLEIAVTICRYASVIMDNLSQSHKLKEEREILDKQKEILDKYVSVGKLAAGVVHEVNNPLDGIIRYTNMLLHQIHENSVAREYLLEIKKGLNRIANITKSLLEFSRQVNSNIPKTKRYIDIHALINESLDVFSSKLGNNIRVVKNFKESLPRILDLSLSQVFINLIKNAIDAMPDGGRLEISTDITDSRIKVSFKDSGAGIPEEHKEHIFEPFFSTKSIDKGTGLGLSISQEIIHRYGGSVEFQSSKDEGTVFHILIPKEHLENEQ